MRARLLSIVVVPGVSLIALVSPQSRASDGDCEKAISAFFDDKADDLDAADFKSNDLQRQVAVKTERKLKRHGQVLKCLEDGCNNKSADHCLTLSFIEGMRGNRERAMEVGRIACRLRHSEAECKRAEAVNTENLQAAQESLKRADESLKKIDGLIADEEKKCREGNCAMCDDIGGFHQGGRDPQDKLKAKELYQIGCRHGCATSCERLAKLN